MIGLLDFILHLSKSDFPVKPWTESYVVYLFYLVIFNLISYKQILQKIFGFTVELQFQPDSCHSYSLLPYSDLFVLTIIVLC